MCIITSLVLFSSSKSPPTQFFKTKACSSSPSDAARDTGSDCLWGRCTSCFRRTGSCTSKYAPLEHHLSFTCSGSGRTWREIKAVIRMLIIFNWLCFCLDSGLFRTIDVTHCLTQSGIWTCSVGMRRDSSWRLLTNWSFLLNLELSWRNKNLF